MRIPKLLHTLIRQTHLKEVPNQTVVSSLSPSDYCAPNELITNLQLRLIMGNHDTTLFIHNLYGFSELTSTEKSVIRIQVRNKSSESSSDQTVTPKSIENDCGSNCQLPSFKLRVNYIQAITVKIKMKKQLCIGNGLKLKTFVDTSNVLSTTIPTYCYSWFFQKQKSVAVTFRSPVPPE
ncbi:unnamed protein product [Caenorhabditis nigoni]